MRLLVALVGAASLLWGGAVPAFSSTLQQPWVLDFSTGVTRAYFSVDTQINVTDYCGGYGWIKFRLGDVVTPLIVCDLICDSSKQFSFTTYACDGTSYTMDITPVNCIVDGANVLKHYTFPANSTFQPVCVSSAVINFPALIYPVEVRYLDIGYSPVNTGISSSVISELLSNATFQTTISSITAVSEMADFLTFRGLSGGVHSWIWGAIFMLTFVAALAAGFRSI